MRPVSEQTISESALELFFREAGIRLAAAEVQTEIAPEKVEHFFRDAKERIKLWEERDQGEASRFNVFDLILPDENRLSDVLKLLLDPRGVHGQGDKFLQLLLNHLKVSLRPELTRYAMVRREHVTNRIDNSRRRIDLLVDATELLIGIENKVNASEQPEQVKNYLEHLGRWVTARTGSGSRCRSLLIYLTPEDGPLKSLSLEDRRREEEAKRLVCWSYGKELRAWLKECLDGCKAPRVQYFLLNFLQYIDERLNRAPDSER